MSVPLSSTASDCSENQVASQLEDSKGSNGKFDPAILPELLNSYYKRLFPYNLFYRWLNYSSQDRNFFGLREFCFTLKDDVYLRYKSFTDQKEMEKGIQSYCPYKIDLGAIFSARIKDTKLNPSTVAVQRELIFDIDMTDYDEVRFCCTGADICSKCWPLMTLAVKIIHRVLTEDFGFQHILWIYSGRRGIHCWICDAKARSLSQQARHAIVDYISLIKGGNVGKARRVNISGFETEHAATSKAIHMVKEYFLKHFVREQAIMESEKGLSKILGMLEDEGLIERVKKAIDLISGSERRWDRLCTEVSNFLANRSSQEGAWKTNNMLIEIQIQFCYPRLDAAVSHGINHLLKSPFSVHPKTGRVCVPINPAAVDTFNPFEVPTVNQLMDEINSYDAAHADEGMTGGGNDENKKVVPDWKKTSLKEGIHLLDRFVKKLEASWIRQKALAEDAKLEF